MIGKDEDREDFLDVELRLYPLLGGIPQEDFDQNALGLQRKILGIPEQTHESLIELGQRCITEGKFRNFKMAVQYVNLTPDVYAHTGLEGHEVKHLTEIE